MHQSVNNLLRRLSGSQGFGGNVFGGPIIHGHHGKALSGSYAPHCWINPGCCSGEQFVQSVSFFFGHHRHVFLLVLVPQHTERLSTFHRMKYVYGLWVDKIIHDFEHIATGIKTNKQNLSS
jgi:hypothetical protein